MILQSSRSLVNRLKTGHMTNRRYGLSWPPQVVYCFQMSVRDRRLRTSLSDSNIQLEWPWIKDSLITCSRYNSRLCTTPTHSLASFPGLAQLSITSTTEKQGEDLGIFSIVSSLVPRPPFNTARGLGTRQEEWLHLWICALAHPTM